MFFINWQFRQLYGEVEYMFEHNYEKRYTYVNGGTAFSFKPSKLTRQSPTKRGGSTLLRMHAEMTLDAVNDGRTDVYILGADGEPLSVEILKSAAIGRWK